MSHCGTVDSASEVSTGAPTEDDKLIKSTSARESFLKKHVREWSRLNNEAANYESGRMTYELMLVRYGSWSNVRWQLLGYTLLILVADFIDNTASSLRTVEGRHVHCCCDQPKRAEHLNEINQEFLNEGFLKFGKYILVFAISISCPLWELYIGRRVALLITTLAGTIGSGLLLFTHPVERLQVIHALLNQCMTFTFIISLANLSEMFPYKIRLICVSVYIFMSGLSNAATILHFFFGFKLRNLGIFAGLGYLTGTMIVLFWIRDSICHLNIRNKADLVEKLVQNEELRLFEREPEGDIKFHGRVARKIFEDLVYLDRDELKLIDFLKRLWRNAPMLEILLAIFQSFSAGLHEYEFNRVFTEQFRGPYLVEMDRVLGYFTTCVALFFLRKFHRVKALAFVFSASLLISALRRSIVNYDVTNLCADINLIDPGYNYLSTILGIMSSCFGSSLQIMIMIHFLETTPSMLRVTCIMVVYTPMKLGWELFTLLVGDDRSNNNMLIIVPIYLYHILIIIVTLARARSKLPFSLYLFDLMPQTEREPESERVDTSEPSNPATNAPSSAPSDSGMKQNVDGSTKRGETKSSMEKLLTKK